MEELFYFPMSWDCKGGWVSTKEAGALKKNPPTLSSEVCGAPKGYLSSYSFSLMVIYFLQVDQQLPCLPVEEQRNATSPRFSAL